MSNELKFDVRYAHPCIREHEWIHMEPAVQLAHRMLHEKRGPGSDFLGWVDLPYRYDREELERIKAAAAHIRENSDAFIVIGIGGSYLGARAAIQMLTHTFFNQLPKRKRQAPEIYFAGHHMSGPYLQHLLDVLDGKDVSINVISKSGTTTEPAIAFRLLRKWLENKYGKDEARKRIYATTDGSKGALKQFADREGYETFTIPDDIGGRFSVLTPVGLLPMAVAGIDVEAILAGAREAADRFRIPSLADNDCYRYAAVRNALYRKGKTTELFVYYEPQLQYMAEWWKQLYGESEGKDGKGIFPASAQFSTDLHSLGQYIQDGQRHLFETVLFVENVQEDVAIKADEDNWDRLNDLSGQTVSFVNRQAFQGTLFAHADGGVPNLVLTVPELSPSVFGQLVYFFEKACSISGYLLGVNPFDQPGVESYKRNMFALLGKPGFEEMKARLEKRLKE